MLKFKELSDKNKRIFIIVSVLVLFIGVTLAYVVAQLSGGATGNANVTADTTDNLQFSVDKDISLNPTQFNVLEGGGGLSDTAIGTASLLANSTNDTASYTYYVYFSINSNDYIYTTEDNKPEIVLTITDPTGAPVTEVNGLTYVNAQNADGTTVSGFDITTASGLFNIASLYPITSSSAITATNQNWTFTVTFINLTTNQTDNGGKTLNAQVILSREEKVTFAEYITTQVYTGFDGENGLYYHDGMTLSGVCKYNGNDVYSSITYMQNQEMELSNNYTYCEKVFQVSINGTPMLYLDNSAGNLITNVGPVIWDTLDNTCKTQNGNNPVVNAMFQTITQNACTGDAYLVGSYYVAGLSEVGTGSFENQETIEFPEEAGDNSYRYSGANPNNYVCFGSTESPCPEENLYRIIGAFDDDKDGNYQIKLIKADYVTSAMLGTDGRDYDGTYSDLTSNYKGSMELSSIAAYRWNYDTDVSAYGSNNWVTSEFNTINLNTNYWNYLGSTWQNLIAETTWHLGGLEDVEYTAKAFYDGERNNAGYGSNPTTYSDEIGLMYPSDYGYAASPYAWTTNLNDYENSTIKSNNWMYMGLYEWTITPSLSRSRVVFSVHVFGFLGVYAASNEFAARPVFYLKSSIAISGGSGTSSDPYRLAV